MTDEMLALARENQRKSGLQNVEFIKGEIENIPFPDNSVDVIVLCRTASSICRPRKTACSRRLFEFSGLEAAWPSRMWGGSW
jgi:hypothetical protein